MKLLRPIYCLFFTHCPVFTSGNPSDPINNFEIEKQRRSELSLLNDVPNIEEQKANLKALRNYFAIEKRRLSELSLLNDLSGAGNFVSSLELSLLNDVPNILT